MNRNIKILMMGLAILAIGSFTQIVAEDKPVFDPNFHIYLLMGQSNMEGTPQPMPEDMVENPRIKVLAYQNNPRLGRIYNKWAIAVPPLHSNYLGLGPGDYFARTLIEKMPEDVTIGLVPLGICGIDLDFYMKGIVSTRRSEFKIPPDNHWDGAYEWVIERAKEAQKHGVIKGILFHQGESDSGKRNWQTKMKVLTENLRSDLDIPNAPILVGELLYGGGCEGHNLIIQNTAKSIPNAWLVKTDGLGGLDRFHFNLEGQRELGRRYAAKMIEALDIK